MNTRSKGWLLTVEEYERIHNVLRKRLASLMLDLDSRARGERQRAPSSEPEQTYADERADLYREAARHIDRAAGALEEIERRAAEQHALNAS